MTTCFRDLSKYSYLFRWISIVSCFVRQLVISYPFLFPRREEEKENEVALIILFASFFVSVLCFFFDGSQKERKRATTIAVAIARKAITIWKAIQRRSHEPICYQVGRAINKWFAIEKSPILLWQYCKNYHF